VAEDLGPEAKTEKRRKRRPVPKIERQMEKLRNLPEDEQKIISKMIDLWTR
jgi:hypothetical protein